MQHVRTALPAAIGFLLIAACSPRSSETSVPYSVDVSPADFVRVIDNPYFPLSRGATYVYETSTDEGTERIVVEVLSDTKQVMGITATVVRDTVTLAGELIEDTFDWYAQDRDGNVWYLGEDVSNYENGQFRDKVGSWEAGIDGALPGMIMYSDPAAHIGETYRQEYYAGNAEDMADLSGITASVSVPAGSFTDVVKTRDYTPLEAGMVEYKYYAHGVGLVKTENPETGEEDLLIEYTTP